MYLEIHVLIFLQLFLFISFSSAAPLKPQLSSLTQWHLCQTSATSETHPTLPRQRPDEFTGTTFSSSRCLYNVPNTFLRTFWHFTLCNPDTLARLISDCVFAPGCYDDIVLRKCSGKVNSCSSAEMLLYCFISDF